MSEKTDEAVDIKKWHKETYDCGHCRFCTLGNFHEMGTVQPNCPSGEYYRFESFYPMGRFELIRVLNEGIIKEPTEELLKVAFACPAGGACSTQCSELTQLGAEIPSHEHVFEDLRAWLVEKGWGPMPEQARYGESTRENHNPYGEPHEERFAWLDEDLPEKEETIYFAGCTASYRQKKIAKSTVNALKAADLPFTILEDDEWCCGSPLLRTGQRELAEELAYHNVEEIESRGTKRLITSCAGCYRTIADEYPEIIGRELGFEVVHSPELFVSLIDEGKIKPNNIDMKVTYHDPCHIGRHMDIYEPPRKVLQNIPGIELIEMPRNRENAWCCAAGGGVKAAFPDFALWSASERVKEAEETGANALTSACPFCKRNLTDAMKELESDLEFYDVMELVSKALGEG